MYLCDLGARINQRLFEPCLDPYMQRDLQIKLHISIARLRVLFNCMATLTLTLQRRKKPISSYKAGCGHERYLTMDDDGVEKSTCFPVYYCRRVVGGACFTWPGRQGMVVALSGLDLS